MSGAVSVVIPAWNEASSIAAAVRGAHEAMAGREHEIIVVDDGSDDDTAAKALEAGARTVPHWSRKGYGAALKTGIRQAAHGLIVTMDADGQHDPADIVRLLDRLDDGYDLVIGARGKDSYQYASRMPGKVFLQWFAAYLVGERPDDVNSGLRAFRKDDAIGYFSLLPNRFSFSTTLTLAMMKDAWRVGFIPIQTRPREGRRSTVGLADGLRTLMLIVRIAALFNPLKVFAPISGVLFALGAGYAGWDLYRQWNIPDGAVLAMLAGIVIFFFGVLADQLASIRRGR